MVSSLKITKLNANNNNVHTDNRQKVNVFYDDNMVSVKNNGASNGNKQTTIKTIILNPMLMATFV